MCHSGLLNGQRHSEQLAGRAPLWAGIKVTAVLAQGYAWAEDKEHCEEYGRMLSADPTKVSQRAKKRGLPQVRTLSAFEFCRSSREVSAARIQRMRQKEQLLHAPICRSLSWTGVQDVRWSG